MKTLLLSATMQPLRVIPWENAIKMRYEGTVDVLEEYEETVSSPSVTWRMPAVIREKRVVKRPKRGVRFSPANVFLRDNYTCQYCGKGFEPSQLECEHVVPESHGGKKVWENIVAACRACNARKGAYECDEIGMWPINKPVRPRSLPQRPLRVRGEVPAEWVPYLEVA